MLLATLLAAFLLPDPQDPASLTSELRKGSRGSYEAAIAAGEAIVPSMLALLADTKESSVPRFMAANVLGEIGSDAAVPGLITALADSDPSVRRCSALALGWIGDPRAKAPLEKLAAEDPASWEDPVTKAPMYLVRDDARKALVTLARADLQLDDASRPPPLALECEVRRLPWPFPGSSREQNLFNNYQQPTDSYVHAGLDLLHERGTEVRAVERGWVRLVDTNYPDWRTHHYFVVTTRKDGDEGFCYTHVDPDSYTFEVGQEIRQGEVLGKLVDFSVGANDGVDHLHLDYVRLVPDAKGRLEPKDLVDPLVFFAHEDDVPPTIEEQVRFVRRGSLTEFPADEKGVPTVAGRVDAIAGLSDSAWKDQGCNWGVPVVTLEIRGEKSAPWRKLVLDLRGAVGDARAAPAMFVPSEAAKKWGTPFWIHWTILTHTDGDGRLDRDDGRYSWDTAAKDAAGKPRFPNGDYEVIVRAWDLAGNAAERKTKVRVRNGE